MRGRGTKPPDYVWAVDVNVVKIEIGLANVQDLGTPGQRADQGDNFVASSDAVEIPAMSSSLIVQTIEGPTRNNNAVQRGIRFMELGFVQFVNVEEYKTEFNNNRPTTTHITSGNSYLDLVTRTLNGAKLRTEAPWYDATNLTGNQATLGVKSSLGDRQLNVVTFEMADTPITEITQNADLSHPALQFASKANQVDITFNFDLFFAVRTKDGKGASKVADRDPTRIYTQLAATSWTWDGSGTINANGIWQSTTADPVAVEEFQEVTDGSIVDFSELTHSDTPYLERADKAVIFNDVLLEDDRWV